MRVSTDFEGARVDVLSIEGGRIILEIPPDLAAPRFRQHFAFDVLGSPGQEVELRFRNAGECTWADAFGGPYKVYVSDGSAWGRARTRYRQGVLAVRHRLVGRRARFAYYPPFPSSRLARLRKLTVGAGGRVRMLAHTVAGAPIEAYVFGGERVAKKVWIIAQQHPGEAMAGWFVEGLVAALASGRPAVERLLGRARVAVVPRMNPDGAAVGNHRTTPAGVDLNRAWGFDKPPVEVESVRAAMTAEGVDLLLDVHGDERLPWVFAQAADGRPAALARLEARFEAAMMRATPDFQTKHKYPYDDAGKTNLAFSTNWAQDRFGCLAMVLEMPFADHLGKPDPRGFFPGRARRLGRAVLAGVAAVVGDPARAGQRRGSAAL